LEDCGDAGSIILEFGVIDDIEIKFSIAVPFSDAHIEALTGTTDWNTVIRTW
jgi:hypothetical protein